MLELQTSVNGYSYLAILPPKKIQSSVSDGSQEGLQERDLPHNVLFCFPSVILVWLHNTVGNEEFQVETQGYLTNK